MSEYVFNFNAIGTARETSHGAYNRSGVKVFNAKTVEEATEKASEYFRPNKQFRFEYFYAGMARDSLDKDKS